MALRRHTADAALASLSLALVRGRRTPQAELSRDFARCLVAAVATGPTPPPASAPGGAAATAPPPPPPGPLGAPGAGSAVTEGRGADEAVGFAVGWLVAGELQVLEVAVHPAHRRRGLGAALLTRLMDDCG